MERPEASDETTCHSTRLHTTAAKSLVIPQADEGVNVTLREHFFTVHAAIFFTRLT